MIVSRLALLFTAVFAIAATCFEDYQSVRHADRLFPRRSPMQNYYGAYRTSKTCSDGSIRARTMEHELFDRIVQEDSSSRTTCECSSGLGVIFFRIPPLWTITGTTGFVSWNNYVAVALRILWLRTILTRTRTITHRVETEWIRLHPRTRLIHSSYMAGFWMNIIPFHQSLLTCYLAWALTNSETFFRDVIRIYPSTNPKSTSQSLQAIATSNNL
jgi:hypothetical protein